METSSEAMSTTGPGLGTVYLNALNIANPKFDSDIFWLVGVQKVLI